MSQFDFFIISKLTVIFPSFVVFIAFFIFFSLVVPTWLVKMVRILFKCELIAETKRFAALVARHNASIFAALLSLDMLEQFLLKVGFFFGVFFLYRRFHFANSLFVSYIQFIFTGNAVEFCCFRYPRCNAR